jgi:hypothetical protein
MDEEFRNRMAEFLSKYIDITDNRYGYGHEKVIRSGIRELISSGLFTVDGLRREFAKSSGLIIPTKYITDCLI